MQDTKSLHMHQYPENFKWLLDDVSDRNDHIILRQRTRHNPNHVSTRQEMYV